MHVRVLVDGVYDIFHFGHANGLRQAKKFGNILVAGVNSTKSAGESKNIPIMTDRERIQIIRSCKWVDEVVEFTPYKINLAFVKSLNCQLVAHGDDTIILSGHDCYEEVKKAQIYKNFERTEYISSTDIIRRILHREQYKSVISEQQKMYYKNLKAKFYQKKQKSGRVVYISGTFDLYHAGHASLIEAARKDGDFLMIGLHNDDDILQQKGVAPIMNEYERMLILYSNKYVDEVVCNAKLHPDVAYLKNFGVKIIYCGKNDKSISNEIRNQFQVKEFANEFIYLNTQYICNRVTDNLSEMTKKISK